MTFESDGARRALGERMLGVRGLLTQDEFATRLGVSSKTVMRWEAGATVPDGASLLALKREFAVDPGWVLTGDGYEPTITARERGLLDNFRRASDAGKRALEMTAAALVSSLGNRQGAVQPAAAQQSMVFHDQVGVVARDITNFNAGRKKT